MGRRTNPNVVSGNCLSNQPIECKDGRCVYYDEGTNLDKAREVAKKGDVAIVFVGTTSSEGGDRRSLTLDDNAD